MGFILDFRDIHLSPEEFSLVISFSLFFFIVNGQKISREGRISGYAKARDERSNLAINDMEFSLIGYGQGKVSAFGKRGGLYTEHTFLASASLGLFCFFKI